ncbi:MAG: peptidylprolyl isomerase [Erysipelothrix sp.]|nr:peptidylprolyl isomerase [Erysipelothrix sp.]
MNKNPIATIKFENVGEIQFELRVDQAPQSVYNFCELANNGYYDGLSMHRIIRNFVAQGGDPTGTGMGGPGYTIKGEFANNRVDNQTQHDKGAIAFARSMARDSAGSQFYIVTGDYDAANMKRMNEDYAAFGNMISGEDVVDVINNEYASNSGEPLKPLTIETITINSHNETLPSPDKL